MYRTTGPLVVPERPIAVPDGHTFSQRSGEKLPATPSGAESLRRHGDSFSVPPPVSSGINSSEVDLKQQNKADGSSGFLQRVRSSLAVLTGHSEKSSMSQGAGFRSAAPTTIDTDLKLPFQAVHKVPSLQIHSVPADVSDVADRVTNAARRDSPRGSDSDDEEDDPVVVYTPPIRIRRLGNGGISPTSQSTGSSHPQRIITRYGHGGRNAAATTTAGGRCIPHPGTIATEGTDGGGRGSEEYGNPEVFGVTAGLPPRAPAGLAMTGRTTSTGAATTLTVRTSKGANGDSDQDSPVEAINTGSIEYELCDSCMWGPSYFDDRNLLSAHTIESRWRQGTSAAGTPTRLGARLQSPYPHGGTQDGSADGGLLPFDTPQIPPPIRRRAAPVAYMAGASGAFAAAAVATAARTSPALQQSASGSGHYYSEDPIPAVTTLDGTRFPTAPLGATGANSRCIGHTRTGSGGSVTAPTVGKPVDPHVSPARQTSAPAAMVSGPATRAATGAPTCAVKCCPRCGEISQCS